MRVPADMPRSAQVTRKGRGELLVPLAVVIANIASLAVALLAPAILPPSEYSTFALAWAFGQLVMTVCFEWLRFATIRFSAGPDPDLARAYGALIAATYRRLAALIGLPALAAIAFVHGGGLAATLPFAMLYAVCQGTFDGRQAFARAARDNIPFARDWAIRAVLCIGLVATTAWITRSGAATTVALSLSFPITFAIGRLLDRGRKPAADRAPLRWKEMPRLVRYGGLGAVSGVMAYAMPTFIRWSLADTLGREGAAGALLAADLSQKALIVAGLAVNIVMMQNTFSAIDSRDGAAIALANRRQVAWACATVVPLTLFIWLLGGDAADALMKAGYRSAFISAIGPCALAGGLICVRLFALDPLFLGHEKPGFSVMGSAVALGSCMIGLALPGHLYGYKTDPLAVYWISSALGLGISTLIALFVVRIEVPWSQLARISLAGALVVLVGSALPPMGGLAGLVIRSAALGLTYGVAALVLDVVWLRSELMPRLIKQDFGRKSV